MKLLPQQLMRGVELAAAGLPQNATPAELACALASEVVGCVPVRRRANGHGFEAVPLPGGFHDPWALGATNARDVKRSAERWAKASAVGITLPHSAIDWVLDITTRKLTKFVERVDVTFR